METAVLLSLPVIALFGFMGFRDGVVKRVIEIAGVFVTLILTARFATGAAPWVMDQTSVSESAALLITWAGLFFAGLILSRLLAVMLSKAIRLTILGGLDKIGGIIIGLALGTLVASVILVAISQVPGGKSIKASYDKDPVGRFVFYAAPSMYEFVRGLGGGKVDQMWERALHESKEAASEAGKKVSETVGEATNEIKEEATEEIKDKINEELDNH